MADKKISALTSATEPLTGVEAVPIVQNSATVKVSVDSLTKGRDVTVKSVFINAPNGPARFGNGTTLVSTGSIYYDNSPDEFVISHDYSVGKLVFKTNSVTKASLDVSGNFTVSLGNLVMGTSGKGITLKSPNGLITKTLTIDNAGSITLI